MQVYTNIYRSTSFRDPRPRLGIARAKSMSTILVGSPDRLSKTAPNDTAEFRGWRPVAVDYQDPGTTRFPEPLQIAFSTRRCQPVPRFQCRLEVPSETFPLPSSPAEPDFRRRGRFCHAHWSEGTRTSAGPAPRPRSRQDSLGPRRRRRTPPQATRPPRQWR